MEGFIDLKRKKVDRVPDLLVPQPDFHQPLKQYDPLKGLLLESSKAFHKEGPIFLQQSSPVFENPFEKYGVIPQVSLLSQNELNSPIPCTTVGIQPEENFLKGCVKYTKKRGLENMVAELKNLSSGNHGCIVNENFQPDADAYLKGYHFVVEENLGKGSNGKTQLCYDSTSGKPYVRKKLLKSSLRTSEVLVPVNVDHANLTKFYGLIQRQKSDGTLKMELMLEYGGTALNHYLRDNTLTDSDKWEATGQGLSGLQQLGYFGMIHLDIKPENICITKTSRGQLVLKITDFGSAKLPQEEISFAGWTPEYMAPESCKLVLQTTHAGLNFGVDEDSVTSKVDVFAFALVVMYFYKRYHILQSLITKGQKSYAGLDDGQKRALQLQLMICLAHEDLIENLIPDECDLDMRDLLQKMTTHDYTHRLDAQQSLKVVEDRANRQRALTVRQEGYGDPSFSLSPKPADKVVPRFIPVGETVIPEVAMNHMEMETGPIKNNTKDKLRQKLVRGPYRNPGKKGSGKGVYTAPNKTAPPQTPVEEMNKLSLSHQPNTNTTSQRRERGLIVTQPTEEAYNSIPMNGGSRFGQMATALQVPSQPQYQVIVPSPSMQAQPQYQVIVPSPSMQAQSQYQVMVPSPRMHAQPQYQTAGLTRPYQVTDRTSGVPMLPCEEEMPMEFDNTCEKMTDRTPAVQIGMSQQEDFTTSVAAPKPVQLRREDALRLLAGLLRKSNITFGNTDKTVEEHPGFDMGPTATMSGAHVGSTATVSGAHVGPTATVSGAHVGPTASVSGAQESFIQPVEQTVSAPTEAVEQGNMPNFSFL